jgi:dTDP-glucose 4,6-dehydratase
MEDKKTILITGISGFIGSHMLAHVLKNTDWNVIGLARLNFAGDLNRNAEALEEFTKEEKDRVKYVYHDLNFSLCGDKVDRIGKLDYIIHLAANSHVDRSITHPKEFFQDNVMGTVNLLEFARLHHPKVRLLNFGTDEVFGPAPMGYDYKEDDRYYPSNPYSAAKAGQLEAGISYFVTYGMPIITTHMMNVFGERQNKEKLVPLAIDRIIKGTPIQIHSKLDDKGNVEYVGQRHWLHARNACDATLYVLQHGTPGEKYNIVGDIELDNDELVKTIGKVLGKEPVLEYVDFHKARPGHDRRYALDGTKLKNLGWVAPVGFEESLKKTIQWTLDNTGQDKKFGSALGSSISYMESEEYEE